MSAQPIESLAAPLPPRQGEPPVLRLAPIPVSEPHPAQRVSPPPAPDAGVSEGQTALLLPLPSDTGRHPRTLVIDPARPTAGWVSGPRSFHGGPTADPGPPGSARRGRDGRLTVNCDPADDDPVEPLADPQAWVAQFVQAAVEVVAGLRPASQLVRWTTIEVHAALVRKATLTHRFDRPRSQRQRVRVRTVVVCLPAPGVCEASAVVSHAGRVRAVALRAEPCDGRWRVTALRIG